MKRTYIKPAVEILDIETKATCAATSWHVSGKNTNPETDSGWVIEGKDKDEYGEGEYDPWDSTKWYL